ncbi:MAG: bifunctional ADP-heptose synthase [Parachlamydiales bacterium]|jgi:D-beta-D-heptose 7-phosphate kinase/D-beta-D-heptose 1-phosphate adenosyltransferase
MVSLCGMVGRLERRRVLVVGDLIVDKYTIGHARRISPEAPVAVVHVASVDQRPGGSGNVVLNFISLGAQVKVLGRVGDDAAGHHLIQALNSEGADTSGIFCEKTALTPLKDRIIAAGQQVVRVDHERIDPLHPELEARMIAMIPILMADIEVVAISDYGKGSITPNLLKHIIIEARSREIPIIADPKGTDFSRYCGATILKPNLGEAYAAASLPRSAPLENVAKAIFEKAKVEVLMITRSEEGISLFYPDGRHDQFPVEAVEVKDVTGAGDTVLAIMAYAIANELNFSEAAQLSNIAAGIAISQLGCARISPAMIVSALLKKDVINKVFEDEHLFTLQEALKGHSFNILGLSLSQGLQPSHFEAIYKLTSESKKELILYIQDNTPQPILINILASLNTVNYIIVHGHNLKKLCQQISPDNVYLIENNTLIHTPEVNSLVKSL